MLPASVPPGSREPHGAVPVHSPASGPFNELSRLTSLPPRLEAFSLCDVCAAPLRRGSATLLFLSRYGQGERRSTPRNGRQIRVCRESPARDQSQERRSSTGCFRNRLIEDLYQKNSSDTAKQPRAITPPLMVTHTLRRSHRKSVRTISYPSRDILSLTPLDNRPAVGKRG